MQANDIDELDDIIGILNSTKGQKEKARHITPEPYAD